MQNDPVIEIKQLQKNFVLKEHGKKQQIKAIRGVDLIVGPGQIFGFLGPNGAGKSTTQKILSTLMRPSGGEVKILGYDLIKQPNKIRQNVGFVSQTGGANLALSGTENLVLQAQLFGIDTPTAKHLAAKVSQRFQMLNYINRPTSTYSGGQKRRLDIALGMIHHPQLLLLDEPTTGLDPQSRAYLWIEIQKLKTEGVTILLTTQYMDEADKLCDTLAIIDHGKIITQGTPDELKRSVGGDTIVFSFPSQTIAHQAKELLNEHVVLERLNITDRSVYLTLKDGERALPDLLRLLDGSELTVQSVTLARPSLDDVFLKYTGRSLRDDESEKQ
ncbi:MAG: ATP-binding cassette domain-containing protein [Nitrososphaerota archaeon]|jgi:ABC-2 type transport system ATP-binding protein|nr:ATP-binding cassette domain-containing protein [Nitrososphaerota archaeon]